MAAIRSIFSKEDKIMKKAFGFIAMMLAIAACNKNEIDPLVENTGSIPFTATISIGDNMNTKALAEAADGLLPSWAEGEKVALIHNGVNDEMTVSSVNEGVATITGTLTGSPNNGDAVTVIYPSSAADGTTGNVKADLLDAQDGTLSGSNGTSIAEKYDVRKGTGKLSISGGNATVNNGTAGSPLSLTNQLAIFKFSITDGTAALAVKPLTVTIGTQDYVIDPDTATSELYVALPAVSDQTVTFTAKGSDSKTYMASKASVSFTVGKYYQSTVKMDRPSFTINASGNKVVFAPGNLQYKDDEITYKWRFAENQWEYAGSWNTSTWVDLFGWGTWTGSTHNPLNTTNSSSFDTYSWDEEDFTKESLLVDASQRGYNWRTLSKAEWDWILGVSNEDSGTYPVGTTLPAGKSYNCRKSSTIGTTTNARWVKAQVHGKKGLIVFPDVITWNVTSMGDAPATINVRDNDYGYSPSDTQWTALESAGCVFLPAAGTRSVGTVYNADTEGYYYTSTRTGDTVHYLVFKNASICLNAFIPQNGYSVRLVRVVE